MTRTELEEWRRSQVAEFDTPSGLHVKVQKPDYLLLVQDWIQLGVKNPFAQKIKLGEEIAKPEVMRALLIKYVKSPKMSEKDTKDSLNVDNLIKQHPLDAEIIYAKIISPFITQAGAVADFFREYGSWIEAGLAGIIDKEVAKRAAAVLKPKKPHR